MKSRRRAFLGSLAALPLAPAMGKAETPPATPPPEGLADDPVSDRKSKATSRKQAELAILRARKLAAVFDDQIRQAEWAFEDAHEQLVARFRRVYNDVTYEAFETSKLTVEVKRGETKKDIPLD